MPRHLQSKIHSDFSSDSVTWSNYRDLITELYIISKDQKKTDFDDHLIREYNRKIKNLDQNIDLFISPFDSGYRFIGKLQAGLWTFNDPAAGTTITDLNVDFIGDSANINWGDGVTNALTSDININHTY